MTFVPKIKLSLTTVFSFLINTGFCNQEDLKSIQVELKEAKNFNLLISLPNDCKLLVKQERFDRDGKIDNELINEWHFYKLLKHFPDVGRLIPLVSEVLHFDAGNSILVCKYLVDYLDLENFYRKEQVFPTAIAALIGTVLAELHRATLNRQDCCDFICQVSEGEFRNQFHNLAKGLERIGPEIFGRIPADGIKFFALYQRYDSLGTAIAELSGAFEPCCLIHNDLKLNNILLHNDWEQALSKVEQSSNSLVRLIDWECCSWGDPAFDLGMLIASYLQIWLGSLVVSKAIDIEEALRLAMTPLEQIQPSIAALTRAYLAEFPEILERRPYFLKRVVQFSGLALIQQIQAMIQYQKSFGNTGICMLQVAKTLLCRPEQSIPTVFGVAEFELTPLSPSLA